MIRISRKAAFQDRFRAYKIVLDDEEIGTIRANETREFEVSPGKHTLVIKIDWATSNTIEFTHGEKDKILDFEVSGGMKGWRILLAILYTSIWSNQYLLLEQKT